MDFRGMEEGQTTAPLVLAETPLELPLDWVLLPCKSVTQIVLIRCTCTLYRSVNR